MQHEIVRAQSQRTFQLTTKRFDRFLQTGLVRSRQIDQIVGVNHQRLQIILLPQAVHDFALGASKLIRTPLPRAGRVDLKRIASQAVGSLRGIFYARRNRSMDFDSPRSPPLRPDRLRPLQRILFRWTKISHLKILKDLTPFRIAQPSLRAGSTADDGRWPTQARCWLEWAGTAAGTKLSSRQVAHPSPVLA